jgi:polysaccharide biosynthesis transport protein
LEKEFSRVREEQHATVADYFAVVRRRWWIIVLAVAITTGSAIFISAREHAAYAATSQVLVNPNDDLVSGAGSAQSDAQARYDSTQAQIAHTIPVATIAVGTTGADGVLPAGLVRGSSVTSDLNSNVLSFRVTYGDPAVAVDLANRYARAFTIYRRQLDQQAIDTALKGLAKQTADVKRQFTAAKASGQYLGLIRQNLNKLIDHQQSLLTLRSQTTGGAVVTSAAAHAKQTQPNTKRNGLLAVIVGLVFGTALAFLLHAFDTRIRSAREIGDHLGLTMLARVPTPPRALRKSNRLAMLSHDHVDHGEAYRKLLVAFDFANLPVRGKIVMVTSAVEKEGKSTTVANLAVAMARSGRNVVIVDIDLRRPFLDKLFSVPHEPGISDVALGYVTLDSALQSVAVDDGPKLPAPGPNQRIAATAGTLHVLPAGTSVPSPPDFIGAQTVGDLLQELAGSHDVVLVDSPPLLPVSDPLILSRWVDAMLLVTRSTVIKRGVLAELEDIVSKSPAPVLGFILTAAESDASYGGSYGYGHGYENRASDTRPHAEPQSGATNALESQVESRGQARASKPAGSRARAPKPAASKARASKPAPRPDAEPI